MYKAKSSAHLQVDNESNKIDDIDINASQDNKLRFIIIIMDADNLRIL